MSDYCDPAKSDYSLHEVGAIMTHKWYLSEQAGYDIGWGYAQWSWVMHGHRSRWRHAYQQSGHHCQTQESLNQ